MNAVNYIQRLILLTNDRISVIMVWPCLWFIDHAGALCKQWDKQTQRESSNRACKAVWNRKKQNTMHSDKRSDVR